jgi:hypothetical protein
MYTVKNLLQQKAASFPYIIWSLDESEAVMEFYATDKLPSWDRTGVLAARLQAEA